MSFDARSTNWMNKEKREYSTKDFKFTQKTKNPKHIGQARHISIVLSDKVIEKLNDENVLKEMKERYGRISQYIDYLLAVDLGLIEDIRVK